MNTLLEQTCSVCGSSHLVPFFAMPDVPIFCNVLHSKQQEARDCPKGDIELAFCPSCGFITNVAFDPDKLSYSQDYENSLHYSPRFREYIDSLAERLVENYDLHDKNIIEIGCGKGDFLVSLCETGDNRGVGFDPSYIPRAEHRHLGERVQFIQDFYSEDYQDRQADLICCRHTLEHVANPIDLLKPLRQAIGDRVDTAVFFEVPNALDTFHRLAIWDILYEHCTYFVPSSLTQVFSNCGFEITNLSEAFAGQFLCLEALPVKEKVAISDRKLNNAEKIELLCRDIAAFRSKFQAKLENWQQKLDQIAQANQRAVVWGAGAKGVTFLNLLKDRSAIEYMNFRKHWKYVAGTGQQIVPPEFLQAYRPDVVIVMNPIYEQEIRQLMTDLDLTSEILSV
jgi:hypothetical protein